MPLLKGRSSKAFHANVAIELHHGKKLNQALAIAYAMRRKAKREKTA
jgi:hypothetical protein